MILGGFVFPVLIVVIGLMIGWQPWRKERVFNGSWLGGPLISGAFALSFLYLQEAPSWPPGTGSVVFWIFYFAIAIGLIELAGSLFRPPLWARGLLAILLFRLAVRALAAPLIPREISQTAADAWIDAATLVATTWWIALEMLAHRAKGVSTSFVLIILATGWAVTLVTWHIIRSGTLAATLAALASAFFVMALLNWRISLARGAVSALALLLLLIITHAYFYTNDTFTPQQQFRAALLLASPLLAFVGDLPLVRRSHPLWRLTARIIPLAILVAVLAGMNVRDYMKEEAPNQEMQAY